MSPLALLLSAAAIVLFVLLLFLAWSLSSINRFSEERDERQRKLDEEEQP